MERSKQESMMTITLLLRWMWLWSKIAVISTALEHVENGFRGLVIDKYICIHVYCDIRSKHVLFCWSCVLSGHFKCNSQKQQTGILHQIKEWGPTAKRLHMASSNNFIYFYFSLDSFVLFDGNILHKPQINCLKSWVRLWLFEGKSGANEQLI